MKPLATTLKRISIIATTLSLGSALYIYFIQFENPHSIKLFFNIFLINFIFTIPIGWLISSVFKDLFERKEKIIDYIFVILGYSLFIVFIILLAYFFNLFK